MNMEKETKLFTTRNYLQPIQYLFHYLFLLVRLQFQCILHFFQCTLDCASCQRFGPTARDFDPFVIDFFVLIKTELARKVDRRHMTGFWSQRNRRWSMTPTQNFLLASPNFITFAGLWDGSSPWGPFGHPSVATQHVCIQTTAPLFICRRFEGGTSDLDARYFMIAAHPVTRVQFLAAWGNHTFQFLVSDSLFPPTALEAPYAFFDWVTALLDENHFHPCFSNFERRSHRRHDRRYAMLPRRIRRASFCINDLPVSQLERVQFQFPISANDFTDLC